MTYTMANAILNTIRPFFPVLLVLLTAMPMLAAGEYNITQTVSSTTSWKITIRVPTGKMIQGDTMDITCAAACTIEYHYGGTTPTTSTSPSNASPSNPGGASPTTFIYFASDSTGGTILSRRKLYGAGTMPMDWSKRQYSAGQQVTVVVTAAVATEVLFNASFKELR